MHQSLLTKYLKVLKLIKLPLWQDYLQYLPKLEFNTPIWFPYFKKDINKIESVQKIYTRIICNCCNIHNKLYHERLVKLQLKSLEYRRCKFDLFYYFQTSTRS